MLNHPSYRSRSRQSTASTTPDLDSLHSWSRPMGPRNGGGSATTVTSVWSDADDGATVLPSSEEGIWGRKSAQNEREERRYGGSEGSLARRGSTPCGERPLIELDSDYESYPTRQFSHTSAQPEAGPSSPPLPVTKTSGPKPSEELRRLLRQMEDEVKSSTPADPFVSPIKRPASLPPIRQQISRSPPVPANQRRANWREGRRIGVYPPQREEGDSSPERSRREGDEEEEESPPTPPVRITNPYLYTSRKTSDPSSSSKHRISSRAAVLQNSTSRSSPPTFPSPRHSPSPLETFIATHPAQSDPSSSRSPQTQSGSRKGKERADLNSPPLAQSQNSFTRRPTSSRNYTPRRSSSSSDDGPRKLHHPAPITATAERERPRRTPRRYSVELAPDDSEVFAQELEQDDAVGVDLDEEEEGLGRPWASETGSGSGEGYVSQRDGADYDVDDRRGQSTYDQTNRPLYSSRHTPTPPPIQISVSPKSPNRSREDSSRLSRLLNVAQTHRRETSADVSLPYLSDPEDGEDGVGERSLSERRAGLFRPGSRAGGRESMSPQPERAVERGYSSSPKNQQPSSSRLSTSPRHSRVDRSSTRSFDESQSLTRSSDNSLLHPEYHSFPAPPIRVGMALTPPHTSSSTPAPVTPTPPRHIGETTTSAPTPHPPGWLARSTPVSAQPARAVHFSPLRQTDKDWSVSQGTTSSIGDVSVHRLKYSPKRSDRSHTGSPLKPSTSPLKPPQEVSDPDTSFTGRISRFLHLPTPSTTLRDASADIERARRLSEVAHLRVEESKRAWSDALGELGRQAGDVGKRGARWGRWGWWICVEVLLLWCVFRVTIDYTASLNPHSNTFHTLNLNPHAISTRIPGALSAFVIPRESANFFDMLERYEVWRTVEGVLASAAGGVVVMGGGEDGRGGLGGMRMVGGVPS